MKDEAPIARLHVFRSLGRHLSERYGLGILVGGAGKGATIVGGGSVLTTVIDLFAGIADLRALHEEALVSMPATPDPDVVEHPAGFSMIAVACPANGRVRRLLVGPFVAPGQAEARRGRLFERLAGAGVPADEARHVASLLPALDSRDVIHVCELAGVLAAEAALQAAESEPRRRPDGEGPKYGRLIGKSGVMRDLCAMLDRIAGTDATVYIHGENGTGKELVAREIHEGSRRFDAPFVIQNCSAMNDNLLESELFGHRRGAFTGAVADKPGLFEVADTGTFFLDEVGDMSPSLQVKLLRVLQEGTFTPVGDVVVRKVDVRVICATNRDLGKMVAEGTFREDLYYRINVIGLRIPPLRERADDVPLLAEHFLARAVQKSGFGDKKRLSRDALALLQQHDWPGNVRELENEIERCMVLAGPLVSTIGVEHLSPRLRHRPIAMPTLPDPAARTLPEIVEGLERSLIFDHLQRVRWNKTRAAATLGISRRNLIRKVKQYGFDRHPGER